MSIKEKKTFEQILDILQKENLIDIKIVYAQHFGDNLKDSTGVFIQTRPQKIILLKNSKITYQDLILNLLHEYGHFIDSNKYGESRRWALFNKYEVDDLEIHKYKEYRDTVKSAILTCEYLAEINARKLLKKYKISLFSQKKLDDELARTLVVKKYQMINGVAASVKMLDFLYNVVLCGKVVIDKRYLKDFTYLYKDEP